MLRYMIKSLNRSKKIYLKNKNLSQLISGTYKFERESNDLLKNLGFIKNTEENVKFSTLDILENIFSRFHRIVIQLKQRHNGRNTLEISDEYDVQDLLHSLLSEHFEDIRPEEYTPSYAGNSTRMDFLLKKEKIVIEVKKVRKTMTDASLGAELIIDRDHYRRHQDCKLLLCFIYDPDNILKNPEGITEDFKELINGFETKLYIIPKRY